MQVRIKHGEHDPVQMSGVSPDDLYEVVSEEPAVQGRPGIHPVTAVRGSVDDPYEVERAVPDNLCIGGGPQVQDIHQGALGDCWFLSGLTTTVQQDPSHNTLLYDVRGGTERNLQGARFRLADEPAYHEWYAAVRGDNLFVVRVNGTTVWARRDSPAPVPAIALSDPPRSWGGPPESGDAKTAFDREARTLDSPDVDALAEALAADGPPADATIRCPTRREAPCSNPSPLSRNTSACRPTT